MSAVTESIRELSDIRLEVHRKARQAAFAWFERQSQHPGVKMYLYYISHHISFEIAPTAPGPEWVLARHGHVSSAATLEHVAGMITELAERLPILDEAQSH